MPWIPQLWSREIVNEGGMLREKMIRHIPIDKLKQFEDCISGSAKAGHRESDIDPRWLFISIIGLTMLPWLRLKSLIAYPLCST